MSVSKEQELVESIEARDIGPFQPPANYQFEEELRAPIPRPIPQSLWHGLYGRYNIKPALIPFVIGINVTIFSALPWMQEQSLIFPMLGWLKWIAIGLIAVGIFRFIRNSQSKVAYPYVESGLPIVARIRSLWVQPISLNRGQANQFQYRATIEYVDPESGELQTRQVPSLIISSSDHQRVRCTYRVGQYATALYLPGSTENNIMLFGLLGLRDDLGIVDPNPPSYFRNALLLTALVQAFLFLSAVSLFGQFGYPPVSNKFILVVPSAIIGVLLAVALVVFLARDLKKQHADIDRKNEEALANGSAIEIPVSSINPKWDGVLNRLLPAGVIILGTMTMSAAIFYGILAFVNARMDSSPSVGAYVGIMNFLENQEGASIRSHGIIYRIPGERTNRFFLTSKERMEEFREGPEFAMAEIKPGWLGAAWVSAVNPLPKRSRVEEDREENAEFDRSNDSP